MPVLVLGLLLGAEAADSAEPVAPDLLGGLQGVPLGELLPLVLLTDRFAVGHGETVPVVPRLTRRLPPGTDKKSHIRASRIQGVWSLTLLRPYCLLRSRTSWSTNWQKR